MSGAALDRFVGLIREATGNVVAPARHAFLAGALERRAAAAGFSSPHAYLDSLAGGGLTGEWDRLVPLITIKESAFLRAPQQFAAIEHRVLPRLVAARRGDRRLRAWCAACARGEEAGTLAMLFAESRELAGWSWEILGTDLDAAALEAARRGLYGERAVAALPPAQRGRWLRRRGELFELAPELRERITYRSLNLAHPPWGAAAEGPFDLVLLRNVLIYFRRPLQRRVMEAVAETLAVGGWLFLGASETLWQVQDRLAPCDLGGCFGYRHRAEGGADAAPAGSAAAGGGRAADPPGPSRPGPDAPLPAGRQPSPGAPPAGAPPAPAAPPAPQRAIHERLAEAARLAAAGELDAAAGELAQALAADPSEAAAHALEGYLHHVRGSGEEAITAYRAALYLDPALFQVRLLLADRLAAGGWRRRAAHEYREVLASLERGRELVALDALPLPDRAGVAGRCREALRGVVRGEASQDG
jgi:chemotaxis protein methyltransferase CheR